MRQGGLRLKDLLVSIHEYIARAKGDCTPLHPLNPIIRLNPRKPPEPQTLLFLGVSVGAALMLVARHHESMLEVHAETRVVTLLPRGHELLLSMNDSCLDHGTAMCPKQKVVGQSSLVG